MLYYTEPENYPQTPDMRVYFDSNGVPNYIHNNESIIRYMFTLFGKDDVMKHVPQVLKGIWILDMDGEIHMMTDFHAWKLDIRMHHSYFTMGEGILCGGIFQLGGNSAIKKLNNESGHYLPFNECLNDVDDIIRYEGYTGPIEYELVKVDEYTDMVIRKTYISTGTDTDNYIQW